MNLITVIPVQSENAEQAEKLLDFIHHFSGKGGHCLLAIAADVHEENKARLKISAELAFDHVYPYSIRPLVDAAPSPVAKSNNAIRQVFEHVATHFTWPFAWIEPDCVVNCPDWRYRLSATYAAQPMPFLGHLMKTVPRTEKEQPIFFMARCGIYPNDAITRMSLMGSDIKIPVEILCGPKVEPKMRRSDAFQVVSIATAEDLINVKPLAIVVQGDKNGILMAKLLDAPAVNEVPPMPKAEEAPVVKRKTRRMLREESATATLNGGQ